MTTTTTVLALTIKKQSENQNRINPKLLITLLIIATVKKEKRNLIEFTSSSRSHKWSKIYKKRKEKKKENKKTVAIVGDFIITNILSPSLNNSLNEFFSIIKSFPGATAKDRRD